MFHIVLKQLQFGILAAGLIVMAGCGGGASGPERGSVSGKVSFDGDPIADGVITFVPTGETEGAPAGTTINNGTYSISASNGPGVGTHRVEIVANRKTGKKLPALPPATEEVEEVEQFLPSRFNTGSELTAKISAGSNTADFDLKSE